MRKSFFLDGTRKEMGATIFGDSKGNLSLGNYGGHRSSSEAFDADLEGHDFAWTFSSPPTAVGDFHTHPYKNHVPATFSGADVAFQINAGLNFSVVQSEKAQWLLLSAAKTPKI
jgi:hypothetical protein